MQSLDLLRLVHHLRKTRSYDQATHAIGDIDVTAHSTQARPLNEGSSASRSPSPSKLKPSTVTMMARPGKIARCGDWRRNGTASAIITPHSGAGGCAPKPRNPNAAAVRIMPPTPSVAPTTTNEIKLGNTCRMMIWELLAPNEREASTYSWFLRLSVRARQT